MFRITTNFTGVRSSAKTIFTDFEIGVESTERISVASSFAGSEVAACSLVVVARARQ